MSSLACSAQFIPVGALRTQLPQVSRLNYASARKEGAPTLSPTARPWLWAMASTTMAFAAGLATSEGLAYKATQERSRALSRSRDFALDLDARMRAESQAEGAEARTDLFSKISDICLAGSVAATGATLLIWLTGKSRRADQQQAKVLLGPMLLRGASGGGLVLREKF